MTSLVCWVGVDQRKPSSIYIATDSRISWSQGSVWDAGRKVFASRSRPEIFGYVGDVLFPSLILGQVADAIESPSPLEVSHSEARFDKIRQVVEKAFESLPLSERRPFQIAYGVRVGMGMLAAFRFFSLAWDKGTKWTSREVQPPAASDSIAIWGSGAPSVERWKERWNSSSQRSTSRAIFSSFCDAIGSGSDPKSGGAPQLVGMYRIGPARSIGVIHEARPYVFGLLADPADHGNSGVEWRNRLFERCDVNGVRLDAAQAHHAPKGLGGSVIAKNAVQNAKEVALTPNAADAGADDT